MAQVYPEFELPRWVLTESNKAKRPIVGNLAGSAGAPLSIDEIIAASTDPETTRANLSFNSLQLGLGEYAGDAGLRQAIAELYDKSLVDITADDVVIANATTGANALVFHALVSRGDHVICLYPCYGQLVQYPAAMGAEVSHWCLREDDAGEEWELRIDDLKALIRTGGESGKAKTKMLVLNNPHNPTGTVIPTSLQKKIVEVCKEHNILILSDEIFRPLFHDPPSSTTTASQSEQQQRRLPATSLLEHATPSGFDNIIVTGSLSKPYGLSGVRAGWTATTNPTLRKILISYRQWSISSISVIDEVVAREALSARCRSPLLEKTLASAQQNLGVLGRVVRESGGRLVCRFPGGGGTAFVKVLEAVGGGQVVDDVAFCRGLLEGEGVLLAPGSLTFGQLVGKDDFRGYVRVHITAPPEMFRKGVEGLVRYLDAEDATKS